MTVTMLEARQDRTPDLVADVVARMLDIGDHITAGGAEQRPGWLSLFLADARQLCRLVPAVRAWASTDEDERLARELLEEVADRLWMICAVEASHREKLISDRDGMNLARAINAGGRWSGR